MPLFGRSDEAENRFKEARKLVEKSDKESDIEQAFHLLEEAAMLKPYEEKYRHKLEEIKVIKSNLGK